jgi:hypothetical protein
LLRSCKPPRVFVISPLPPVLFEPLQTAGFPLSTGITPLHRYYEPLLLPLVFHRLPGIPGYTVSCSADFSSGRGGSLQLLSVSLSSCCRFNPARVNRRVSQSATIHAVFALRKGAQPLGLPLFEATSACTFVTARCLAHHPEDGFVDRLRKFAFPPPRYPSYEASDFCLGGSTSH